MSEAFEPPIKYLRTCSDNSLRQYELSKLEHVSNLRRELRVLWEEMIEEFALSLLARWMVENRAALRSNIRPVEPASAAFADPLSPVFVAFDHCVAQSEAEAEITCGPRAPIAARPRLVEHSAPTSRAQFSGSGLSRAAGAGNSRRAGTSPGKEGNGSRSAGKHAVSVRPDGAQIDAD